MTSAVLAFDTGPGAGMGHQRRMDAVATALSERGASSDRVSTEEPVSAEILVVDSYRFRADDASRFRARVLAAVDDLDRDLAVDLVIDPSPGASAGPHRAAGRVLAGPAFALIDPRLGSLTGRVIARDVGTVLVATGAADEQGVGAQLASDVAALLPDARVLLAVGPWGAAATPERVDVLRVTDGLGPALAGADLVITAGGVTLLETLALGRPAVVVILADNQRRAAKGAEAAGAVVLSDPAGAAAAGATLAGDRRHRQALSEAGRALVDGRGAARAADALLSLA